MIPSGHVRRVQLLGVIALLLLLTQEFARSESLVVRGFVIIEIDDSNTGTKTIHCSGGTDFIQEPDGRLIMKVLGRPDVVFVSEQTSTSNPIPDFTAPPNWNILARKPTDPGRDHPWPVDILAFGWVGAFVLIGMVLYGFRPKLRDRAVATVPSNRSNPDPSPPRWDDDLVTYLAQMLSTTREDASKLTSSWKNGPKSYQIDSARFRVKKRRIESCLLQVDAHERHINDLREHLARGGQGTERMAWQLELEKHVAEQRGSIDQLRSMLQEILS